MNKSFKKLITNSLLYTRFLTAYKPLPRSVLRMRPTDTSGNLIWNMCCICMSHKEKKENKKLFPKKEFVDHIQNPTLRETKSYKNMYGEKVT